MMNREIVVRSPSGTPYSMDDLTLAIVEEGSSWNFYVNDEGFIFSISTTGTGKNTPFGDKYLIKARMNLNYFNCSDKIFTDRGLEVMSGLNTKIIFNEDGTIKSHWLNFD